LGKIPCPPEGNWGSPFKKIITLPQKKIGKGKAQPEPILLLVNARRFVKALYQDETKYEGVQTGGKKADSHHIGKVCGEIVPFLPKHKTSAPKKRVENQKEKEGYPPDTFLGEQLGKKKENALTTAIGRGGSFHQRGEKWSLASAGAPRLSR